MMSPDRELRIVSNDVTLAADSIGDPDGPTVVLLHGGGQSRHAWRHTARRLAGEGRQVVTVDLRGHGDSTWSASGAYDVDNFAADIVAVAEQLPGSAAYVGASLGGVSALVAIADAPDQRRLASALVLVDIAPRLEPAGVSRILQFMNDRPEGYESLEEVAIALATYNPNRRPRRPGLDGLRRNMRQRDDGRWIWKWDPRIFASSVDRRFVERVSERIEAAAPLVRVPALLLRGTSSDALSEDGVAHLARIAPQFEVARVAGAGHMVAGDQNDEFNDAVSAFLDRVVPVTSAGGRRVRTP